VPVGVAVAERTGVGVAVVVLLGSGVDGVVVAAGCIQVVSM